MQEIDLKYLIKKNTKKQFTVLPDFSLDIFFEPPESLDQFFSSIQDTYKRGGGNILGSKIRLEIGGNAGNVAQTLAHLEARSAFLCETSPIGKQLLTHHMDQLQIQTEITDTGELSSSLIIEIPDNKEKSNIMFNASGSLVDFNSGKLTEKQWKLLQVSDSIAITNAQNLYLEELTNSILSAVPASTFVSIDFSDLTPHQMRIPNLKQQLFSDSSRPPDLIAGNETEISILSQQSNVNPSEAAHHLSKEYPDTLFALHQADSSEIWKNGTQLAQEPCYQLTVVQATGAGDTWHGGLLYGIQGEISFSEALQFANATAGYKISHGRYGSLYDIIKWSKNQVRYDS